MSILQHFKDRYDQTQEEEYSLEEYLESLDTEDSDSKQRYSLKCNTIHYITIQYWPL